jgi:regulatory protein
MIPNKSKKNLKATIDEIRKFSFSYLEKYAPSKQQLRTYLLKKFFKSSNFMLQKVNY